MKSACGDAFCQCESEHARLHTFIGITFRTLSPQQDLQLIDFNRVFLIDGFHSVHARFVLILQMSTEFNGVAKYTVYVYSILS
jgi:hypothetical protein